MSIALKNDMIAQLQDLARLELAKVLAQQSTKIGEYLAKVMFEPDNAKTTYARGSEKSSVFARAIKAAVNDITKQKVEEWCVTNKDRIDAVVEEAANELLLDPEFKVQVQNKFKETCRLHISVKKKTSVLEEYKDLD